MNSKNHSLLSSQEKLILSTSLWESSIISSSFNSAAISPNKKWLSIFTTHPISHLQISWRTPLISSINIIKKAMKINSKATKSTSETQDKPYKLFLSSSKGKKTLNRFLWKKEFKKLSYLSSLWKTKRILRITSKINTQFQWLWTTFWNHLKE